VKSMWMTVSKTHANMVGLVWTRLEDLSANVGMDMLVTSARVMSMSVHPIHAHPLGPRNVSKWLVTSSACANLAGWENIVNQREIFANRILARMVESVSALKAPTTVCVQLDSVGTRVSTKEKDVTRIHVSMEEPVWMFPLDLFACVQQGQQEVPVTKTQEMSALTTLVFVEAALTK
jgi:hypothetical protein